MWTTSRAGFSADSLTAASWQSKVAAALATSLRRRT